MVWRPEEALGHQETLLLSSRRTQEPFSCSHLHSIRELASGFTASLTFWAERQSVKVNSFQPRLLGAQTEERWG